MSEHDRPGGRRLAASAAFFSVATGMSRIAGLVREMVAAGYYGVTPQAGAFTIAFNVPNLVRALFADAALQAAFVPVFTELLEKGDRREAFRVASTMFYMLLLVLGCITGAFIIFAPIVMPLFAPGAHGAQVDLIVGMSRVLFPIVLLLGLTGLFVGMLNSFDHFEVPAISPLFWNVAIIATIVGLVPAMPEGKEIYAYAIGVLIGTVVQMLMPLPLVVRRSEGESMWRTFDWRNPYVWRIFKLMIPVTIGLGLINFDLAINNYFATFVSEGSPAVIDKAFRLYMLPQGMFSVAIATVLFPRLARFAERRDFAGMGHAVGNGVRQMFLLQLPAAAATIALADPMIRLIYQRGEFSAADTIAVAGVLFWFSFSLPFSGMNLLFTRTFFALQRPWFTTIIAFGAIAIDALFSWLLYKPYGVNGIVIATVGSTILLSLLQGAFLRPRLHGLEVPETVRAILKMVVASVIFGAVAYGVWVGLDALLGRQFVAQIASLGAALTAGLVAYAFAVSRMRIAEAQQISALVGGRLRRNR